ncbi:imm11 family protein [Microbulbifer sp. TRSA001]|uniref:imm11 family protein n=1 Tax=Microbulbifer sp. TRSA001 TaxID=3243381 RepID=UPI0040393206
MKLYKISSDSSKYGSVETFNTKELMSAFGIVKYRKIRSIQQSISDKWPKSHGGFYEMFSEEARELSKIPDVYLWMNVFLMVSKKAKDVLSPLLDIFGEFLPFECNGDEYFIFSVYSVIEPDPSKSKILLNDGIYAGISSLSFKPETIGTHILFKTSFDRFSYLYCTDKFKDIIESNELTGLHFSTDLSSRT